MCTTNKKYDIMICKRYINGIWTMDTRHIVILHYDRLYKLVPQGRLLIIIYKYMTIWYVICKKIILCVLNSRR